MQTYTPDELLRSLVVPPPAFDVALAELVAQTEFGIRAEAESLGGERDRNFLVRAGNQELLLKVTNPAEPDALLAMQNAALRHIESRDPSLPVPRLRPSRNGADWVQALGTDGKTYRVRLLTYLPGLMFSQAHNDVRLLRELGATIARLDRALQGFFHPSADHALAWDLKHAGSLAYLAADLDPKVSRAGKRCARALPLHGDTRFTGASRSAHSQRRVLPQHGGE